MDDDEVARHLREAFAFFESSWIQEGGAPESRVALMRTEDFLRMAPPPAARIESEERFTVIDALMGRGTAFSTPLELLVEADGTDGTVYSHDGRHRAMRLQGRLPYVPVHVVVDDGSGESAPEDALERIAVLYPQPHDDDEEYPGWDSEDLDARTDPVKAGDVFLRLLRVEEVAEILGLGAAPAP